jgi:hypothetical protein
MNVEIGRQNIIILFWNNEVPKFHFWEYINKNLTFMLGSYGPSFAVYLLQVGGGMHLSA